MNKKLILVTILLSTFCFGISYMPKDTPMTCLKACCANQCGNGQWDSDGGFCHGQYAETQACISCQEACREDVGKTGTEPYSSTYPSSDPSPNTQPSWPSGSSSSSGSSGGAGLCGLPAAIMGLVCGLLVFRKIKM